MLVEVKHEFVKQDHRILKKRFLQDAQNRTAIYIWQLPEDAANEMLRFQITYKEFAIDWKAEHGIRFARVDEGDNPMGMKRSPVLEATDSVGRIAMERLCTYLEEHELVPSLPFILHTIETSLKTKRNAN